jgi:hypothetical protein
MPRRKTDAIRPIERKCETMLCSSSVLVWVRSRAKSVRRGRDRFLGEGWLLPRLAKCSSSPGPPSIRSLILLRANRGVLSVGLISSVEPALVHLPLQIVPRDFPSCPDLRVNPNIRSDGGPGHAAALTRFGLNTRGRVEASTFVAAGEPHCSSASLRSRIKMVGPCHARGRSIERRCRRHSIRCARNVER